MSRAFTLAGVAIAVVALAGTADQAGAAPIAATKTIVGKVSHFVMETAAEAAAGKFIATIGGLMNDGRPTDSASPYLTLKGIESLKGIEALKGLDSLNLDQLEVPAGRRQ
jgi:hypothetical protein